MTAILGRLGAGALVLAAAAAWTAAADFELKPGKSLEVLHGGRALLAGDAINYGDGWDAGAMDLRQQDGMTVVNVIHENGDPVQYRRETGVRRDRVELTCEFRLLPYRNTPDKPTVNYTFRIPYARLKNTTATAFCGRARGPQRETQTLGPDRADGKLFSAARYVAFTGSDLRLVVDLNPKGLSTNTDSGGGDFIGAWDISKKGDSVEFSFGYRAAFYGGPYSGKALIYEGEYAWDEVHAYSQWKYYGAHKLDALYCFGASDAPKGWVRADAAAFDAARGCGWARTDGLALTQNASTALAGNAVCGAGDNTFIARAKPGIYVVNLRIGGAEAGPFRVALNGEIKAEGVRVKAGEVKDLHVWTYLRSGDLRVEFSSPARWAVSTLIVQPLLYAYEDFAFDREAWIVPGLFTQEARDTTPGVVARRLTGAFEDFPGPRPEVFRTGDTDAAAWRWNARILMFGTPNHGARSEFADPAVVERRILELKDLGVNAVIMSGLHFRQCYLDRQEMIVRTSKLACDIAHRHGIKVIEHHDVPVLTYAAPSAFAMKMALANLDWMQSDVQYGHLIPSFCINNPGFKKYYFDMLTDYAARTGVDGFMLDEIAFSRGRACGCPHCRALFAKETGLALPDAHDDPFFKTEEGRPEDTFATFSNTDDRRFIRWLEWRMRAISDWQLDLRRALDRINPNLTIMRYTTHSGLTMSTPTFEAGSNLFLATRFADWVGTEIMSRNVYYCPRAIFFYRKMMSGLGDWSGCPVWGLIYHVNDPEIARMGWALNAMTNQQTWMHMIEGADMAYLGWKDKMESRAARSVADIAALFSVQSRNWQRTIGYLPDLGGVSQCMSDAHLQHDILVEPSLTPEVLKKYRLLIVASAGCLSDAQARVIREYVMNGGRLLISGNAGLQDEMGFPRKDFALADVMNVRYTGRRAPRNSALRIEGEQIPLAVQPFQVALNDPAKSRVLAEIVNAKGEVVSPGLIETPCGKGVVIYDACRIASYNWEREKGPGVAAGYERNEAQHRLTVATVRRAHGGALPFEAEGRIPENVFVSVYRQTSGGARQIAVNLLNATGAVLPPGATIPSTVPPPAWPPLAADLEFELDLPGVSGGYVVSPDFDGRRPVALTTSGTRVTVRVSKADLRWFSTVYLDMK